MSSSMPLQTDDDQSQPSHPSQADVETLTAQFSNTNISDAGAHPRPSVYRQTQPQARYSMPLVPASVMPPPVIANHVWNVFEAARDFQIPPVNTPAVHYPLDTLGRPGVRHGRKDHHSDDVKPANENFRCIGQGSFGIIFACRFPIPLCDQAIDGIERQHDVTPAALDDPSLAYDVEHSVYEDWPGDYSANVRRDWVCGREVCLKRTIQIGVDPRRWLENDAMWQEKISRQFAQVAKEGGEVCARVPELYGYSRMNGEGRRREWEDVEIVGVGKEKARDEGESSGSRVMEENNHVMKTKNPKWMLPAEDWFGKLPKTKWFNHKGEEDATYQQPDQIILMERIPPVPKVVRDKLIDQVHPLPTMSREGFDTVEEARESAKRHPANEDALLRVYLGKRKRFGAREGGSSGRPRKFAGVNLRNFNFDLPTMIDLLGREQVEKLTRMIARSLAVMHWRVGCDARDAEFVLGGLPPSSTDRLKQESGRKPRLASTTVRIGRAPDKGEGKGRNNGDQEDDNVFQLFGEEVTLWLLDFNQVQGHKNVESIAFTDQCAKAYWDNDPYYPRPTRAERFDTNYNAKSETPLVDSIERQFPWAVFVDECRRVAYVGTVENRTLMSRWDRQKFLELKSGWTRMLEKEHDERADARQQRIRKMDTQLEEEWMEVKESKSAQDGEWWNQDDPCKKLTPVPE